MRRNIEIIESFILGKREDQNLNEDGMVVTNNYIAVIDGASSASVFNGISGGLLAKNIIVSALETMDNIEDGFEVIEKLNLLLHQAQKEFPESELNPSKRMFASLVIYNINTCQIWNYGDCPFVVNGIIHQYDKKIDVLNANIRSFVNQYALTTGKSIEDILHDDIGAKAITQMLDFQNTFANKVAEYGYPILDGYALCRELFEIVDVFPGDEIILATDGYPKICSSLNESEMELQRLLISDPLCIGENKAVKCRYEGLKSFDDRCYIRFKVR